MVFAEGGGAVAVQPQHLGKGCDAVGARAGLSGEGGGGFGDGAEVIGVVIASGEQRGTRGRAERGGVKVVVAQAIAGEAFGGRHVNGSAECAGLSESHVVDQDDQNVWSASWSLDLETRRSFDLAGIELGDVRIVGLGDRQHRAVRRGVLGSEREAQKKWCECNESDSRGTSLPSRVPITL